MRIRRLLPFAVLAGAIAAAPPPTALRYQVRYWSTQVLDFSPLGQPIQRLGFGYRTWLRIQLADTLPDLKRLLVEVDSARLTQGSQIPLPVDSLGGATWTGLLRANGHLEEWKGLTDRPGAAHFRTLLWQFYPRLTEPLAAGATWSDTVSQQFSEINGRVTFTAATRYRVEGIDTVAARPAWRIVGEIAWSQAADLQFLKGMGTMNGTGTGTGVYHVAVDDRTYLAGDQTIVTELRLARPGASAVPIHDSATTSVVLVP